MTQPTATTTGSSRCRHGAAPKASSATIDLYDLVLVLGYNDRPRIKGKGSAIFVHLARAGYTPTEGCIAFSRRDLLAVLAEIRRGTDFLVMR